MKGSPNRSEYEARLAASTGADHIIAFAYARHGLAGILTALGARPGDRVVLSPLTCTVVPLALLHLGLEPTYADISADTLNLDPRHVEGTIGSTTRAVLFQHTYGHSAGVTEVAAIASRAGVPMIEDCAQCMPIATAAPSPGDTGVASIFSNNLRKPLPAGSGGFVLTRDAALAEKVRRIRDALPDRGALGAALLRAEIAAHGFVVGPKTYWPLYELARFARRLGRKPARRSEITSKVDGLAFGVTGLQAERGIEWLDRARSIADLRRHRCREYAEALAGLPGVRLPATEVTAPLYYFPVVVDRKPQLLRSARRRLIEMIAWPVSTPLYPIEDEALLPTYGYRPGSCPVAERVAAGLVGLPTDFPDSSREAGRLVDLVRHHAGRPADG